MSFRHRLALFLGLIAVLPMVVLTVLLGSVTRDSSAGKADAAVSQGLETALELYGEDVERARTAARGSGRDRRLVAALRAADASAAKARSGILLARFEVAALATSLPAGESLAGVGIDEQERLGYASVRLQTPQEDLGTIEAWASSARAYADRVRSLTHLGAVVVRDGRVLATTLDVGQTPPPASGDAELPVGKRRAGSVALDRASGTSITLLGAPPSSVLDRDQALVALGIVAFFGIAVALALRLLNLNVQFYEDVAHEAVTDHLTGLANQRRFRDLLENEVQRAQRFGQPLSLLVLDLDDFKQVNDTYGHQQGDEVLRRVSLALNGTVRTVDEPARYGGEEFAVALPQTDSGGAMELAERIRIAIEAAPIRRLDGEGAMGVTASIGVASLGEDADSAEDLLAAADAALYRAKAAGKNTVVRAGAPPASVGRGR